MTSTDGKLSPAVRFATPTLALGLALALAACGGNPHMDSVTPDAAAAAVPEGSAKVVFVRQSNFASAIRVAVFDGDTYIGTLTARSNVTHIATPGEHFFMVQGENADFLDAELLPNKTYYVSIAPSIGAFKARFYLAPQNGQTDMATINGWLANTQALKPNATGHQWAADNAASIQSKKERYMKKWNARTDKKKLEAASGI